MLWRGLNIRGQARGRRLPNGTTPGSEVELQSELYLSRILARVDDPESRGSEAKVRSREVRMVKRVQEVSTKLNFHGFCNREVLLQADVNVHVSGTNGRALSRTISKCTRGRRGECTGAEPLQTLDANRLGIADGTIAVGTSFGGAGSGGVASRGSKRETGMPGNNRVDRPVADNGVRGPRHVVPKLFALAKGQLIYSVCTDDVGRIPIASCVIASGVIEVLPVVTGGGGLSGGAPRTVVTVVVGHALLVGIGNLALQSVAIALLQHDLQCVIVHVADGGGVLHVTESVRTKRGRGRSDPVDDGSSWILSADQGIRDCAIWLQIALS